MALQTQTALDINTQYNFITHRPASGVPPSQSSTSEAELHPLRQCNPLSDQWPLGPEAHFSLESVLFIKEHVILPGHRKRQIPHFTTPQMSVAEQNRPSMPNPPLQMFVLDHAQHRKPLKSKSIRRHCGNQGDKPPWKACGGAHCQGSEMHYAACTKYKFIAASWKLVFS